MPQIKHNPRTSSHIQEQFCVIVFIFICGECLADTMVEALLEQLGETSLPPSLLVPVVGDICNRATIEQQVG